MSLLVAREVSRRYPVRAAVARRGPRGPRERWRTVLDRVSVELAAGSTTAMVGGSGAGKTTLVRCLLALDRPDAGTVACQERPVHPGPVRRLHWFRRLVQYVPQDPATSLDPRRRVAELVAEPLARLAVPGDHAELVADALRQVGLSPAVGRRRPGEISGGQAQRVALARAVVTTPALLVADEPVSGLDLPLRRQVLELLARRHAERGTALLLVSHDLAAAARLCARVLVLDAGRVVETGELAAVFDDPVHPATRRLLAAAPRLPSRP